LSKVSFKLHLFVLLAINQGSVKRAQKRWQLGFVVYVALHGQMDAVHILLSRGSYPLDDRDCCGTTPVMDALRAGFVDVAKLLIQQHVCTL